MHSYPHQMSGGMRQRVMIAMALSCNPKVLIADEPTTALDVTIQAQILELLRELQAAFGMAVILITHDMGVVAENADRVIVMYAGRKIEEADVADLFERPAHPYTRGLLASIPHLDEAAKAARRADPAQRDQGHGALARAAAAGLHLCAAMQPRHRQVPGRVPTAGAALAGPLGGLLACRPPAAGGAMNLSLNGGSPATNGRAGQSRCSRCGTSRSSSRSSGGCSRASRGKCAPSTACRSTSGPGRRWGSSASSGCGKSTVGRTLLKLLQPSAGTIHVDGVDITDLDAQAMLPYRRRLQMIYQDPYASLNPRMSAGQIVEEPLVIHGVGEAQERRGRVGFLFERVGLRPELMNSFPHEFSGGQRQRIGIARALALNPELIVGDEPVSALDVSIQAQIINLLMDLQDEYKLSYLLVAHDLAVVQHISHRVAVMYLGRIVEMTEKKRLFEMPLHPYSEALLSAVPIPKASARRRQRVILTGDVPSPINPPAGCHFHTRCPYAHARCRTEPPALREVTPGHWASCHLHDAGPAIPLAAPRGSGGLAA